MMEKKVDKRAEQNADALNRNIDQQARYAPTGVPPDDGTKRRTWEGYAEDYRGLSEELVEVSRRHQGSLAQIDELEAQIKAKDSDFRRVKAQRLKDLDRLAAVSRTRDLLEKRAAAQMAKVAAAMARPSPPPPAPPGPPAVFQPATVDADLPGDQDAVAPSTDQSEAIGFAARLEERADISLGWGDRRWWQQTIKAAQKAHKDQRLSDAQLYFEAALLTKQTSSLWEQLGHVLRESGRFLEGEIAYRRALRTRPDHGEMLFLSGYCLEMAGATSGAIPFYTAALESDPQLVSRYPHLRDFHARLGQ